MKLARITAAVAMVALAVTLIGAGGASADELNQTPGATPGCTTYHADQTAGANAPSSIVVCTGQAAGGGVSVPGGLQACAVTGANGPAVVINQGQASNGMPGAGSSPEAGSNATTGANASGCDSGAAASNQTQPADASTSANAPELQVCSIALPAVAGANGAAEPTTGTAGTLPAGTVVVAGSAQFCASAQAQGKTEHPAASSSCADFAPSALGGVTEGSGSGAVTTTQSAINNPSGSAVVIGSVQTNSGNTAGNVQVCTGDSVSVQPVTVNTGQGCAVALPVSTGAAGAPGAAAPGVTIVTTGPLTCSISGSTNAAGAGGTSGVNGATVTNGQGTNTTVPATSAPSTTEGGVSGSAGAGAPAPVSTPAAGSSAGGAVPPAISTPNP